MLSRSFALNLLFVFVVYIVCILIALCLGDENLSFKELFAYAFGDELERTILYELRLPRILMAILIGMLLASSGLITQNVFQNPIADPYIIGIAQAASFGALLAHFLKLEDYYYGIFAFICSSLFSLILFRLCYNCSLATLLVVGIAFSSFLGAFSSFFIYILGEDSFKIIAWLMGNLSFANYERIVMLFVPLVFCLFYFYAHKNELNIILSGDDEAKNLGVDSKKLKFKLLLIASLAVSFGVAFCGLIAFVGLIIPHIVRLLVKDYNNALILPLCTLLGGIFLLFCDSFARTILAPVQIPIGIITSLFASPVFLYLALKIRKFL